MLSVCEYEYHKSISYGFRCVYIRNSHNRLLPGLPQEKHTTVFQSRRMGPGRDCRTGARLPESKFWSNFSNPANPVAAAEPESPPPDAEEADPPQGGLQCRCRCCRSARQPPTNKKHLIQRRVATAATHRFESVCPSRH